MTIYPDRTSQPEVKDFGTLVLPEAREIMLSNGIPVYVINMGDQEVSRIDVMVTAGKYDQEKSLVADMANVMLKEGAGNRTSAQIAGQLDFYGAWLQNSVSFHNSYVTLYSLNKYFTHTLDILSDLIMRPFFPEEEFSTISLRRKQQLTIELEKVQSLATRAFLSRLFGRHHPYGAVADPHDFDSLTKEDLFKFHRNYYNPKYIRIVITGKITDEMLKLLDLRLGMEFGDFTNKSSSRVFKIEPSTQKEIFVEKVGALQSGIRIGIPVMNRSHPDYLPMRVLNTLLGGYFGSRLMLNIREDKGYTYGISSSLIGQRYGAYLSISTQSATEYTKPLVEEVFNEIERLKCEPVQEEELSMVRNYMLGELARLFDGPFPVADAYISMLANNLSFDYYNRQVDIIRSVTPDDIMRLAGEYLKRDNFYVVVAGSK